MSLNKKTISKLHVDAATGCEYLSSTGGVISRLTPDGQHMGCQK